MFISGLSYTDDIVIPFLAAVIGGIVTAVFFPFLQHFIIRSVNSSRVSVKPEKQVDENSVGYYYLRIINNSWSTLTSVTCFITIDNSIVDIVPEKPSFCSKVVDYELLSWAKVIGGENRPEISLNQGELQSLQILHRDNHSLQIASEEGYYDKEKLKSCRIWLRQKDYNIRVTITAENMNPKHVNLRYNASSNELILL